MRVRELTIALIGATVLCARLMAQAPPAPTGWLDTAPPPSVKFPAEWYSAHDPYHPAPDGGVVHTTAPVVGAPFTGTSVLLTRISPPGEVPRYTRMRAVTMRDSAGRTRTEEEFEMDGMPAVVASQSNRQIEVNDVVTHCSFHWVEPTTTGADRTATVQCLPRTVTLQPDDGMESKMTRHVVETLHPGPGETVQIQPLGESVVAGLKAVGIRQTDIIPGRTLVTEIWWSPEIKETLLMKPIGDTAGEPTIELTDIKREEPDPALFYPPAGYKIVTGAPAN